MKTVRYVRGLKDGLVGSVAICDTTIPSSELGMPGLMVGSVLEEHVDVCLQAMNGELAAPKAGEVKGAAFSIGDRVFVLGSLCRGYIEGVYQDENGFSFRVAYQDANDCVRKEYFTGSQLDFSRNCADFEKQMEKQPKVDPKNAPPGDVPW